jgi:hypothetical protein
MNIHEFAKLLNGRERGNELTREEEKQAKELGYVIVFGASDDLAEFRGAIEDETDCYDGETIHMDKNGVFEDCDSDCKYALAAKGLCKVIEAIWCDDGVYAWTYKTDIPHAIFDIMEDGEKYCRGIVFDIKSLEGDK